jgi:ABC-type dipeptide/oligopeptide/nickel transport system ATPase component
MLSNDFLMDLFKSNALDVKTMLENTSFPFAAKILEAIKRNEEQAAKGEPLEGVSPELLQAIDSEASISKNGNP